MYKLLLENYSYDHRAVFLGRDATPVWYVVKKLSERKTRELEIYNFDISTKLIVEKYEHFEPESRGKGNFLTRLLDEKVSQEEMQKSLFWQYIQQEKFIKDNKITLVDNGINGTLLSRLDKMIQLADPNISVKKIMLYYTGEIPLENLTVVMKDRRKLVKKEDYKTDISYGMALAHFAKENCLLENWPHPYPSASHFSEKEGVISVEHRENALDSLTEWGENRIKNEVLLKEINKRI